MGDNYTDAQLVQVALFAQHIPPELQATATISQAQLQAAFECLRVPVEEGEGTGTSKQLPAQVGAPACPYSHPFY